MAIEAGRVLSGRYRLIRPVGQGSQASVWVAEHLALTTHVAVKLIDPELAKKETARERFRREATAAAQLRSAHVVQILDHGIDDDQPFIVMELLDGEDLFERLAHRTRLTLRETSKIVTQVARALSRAHAANIVHRDLKPENVFLCPNEDDEVTKVLDFGVAKVKDAAKVTMQKTGVGTLIGTPHYMSPEQVKGIGEIDFHADLWALGVIAFQCVTGELPFDSEGVGDLLIKITIGEAPVPSKVYPGVSPSFDAWFAKACAKDPTKRFNSAREMAVALAGIVGVIDGAAPRSPTVRPPPGAAAVVTPLPRPPRAATAAIEVDDWEEVEPFDEDDAPTRMKEGVTMGDPQRVPQTPPAGLLPAARTPAPAPARKGSPAGVAPPKPPARPISGPPGRVVVPASTPPEAPRIPLESQGHEIVDFDETIPAVDLGRGSIALPLIVRAGAQANAAPVLVPLSEPPPPPPSHPRVEPAAPAPASSDRPPVLIAPVVMPAPRPVAAQSAPPSSSGPASAPRPPPPSVRNAPPPSAGARPSPAPVVTAVEPPPRPLYTDPPPEFDGGSKRRRMVRFLVAALVLSAGVITWTVVKSQIEPAPGPAVPPMSATTSAPPPPPPPTPPVTATATSQAVDPGKVTHPSKPTPTPAPGVHKAPFKAKPKPPGDGTIVVPEPDEDAVPPAN